MNSFSHISIDNHFVYFNFFFYQVTYGQLSGTDAAGSIATNVNGGLYYEPLAGDMTSTVHSDPQVRLYINDVPTSCEGDCSFTWESGSTPTVTDVTPTSGIFK